MGAALIVAAMSIHDELESLPIQQIIPQVLAAVQKAMPIVLKAPPGAGKTTGVPIALLNQADATLAGARGGVFSAASDGSQTLLIQPRRMAARAAARRIADLMSTDVGAKVGYHVRFDRQVSAATELVVMTTGILLRRLQRDPLLDGVSCVILDEFHERSLEMDLSLGMLHRVRKTLRPELRLLVMSATLDPDPIVDFLGDAVGLHTEGRSFPVDIRYDQQHTRGRIEDRIAAALPRVLAGSSGDVLVFLPGVGEIRRTEQSAATIAKRYDAEVLPLYGDLSPADQDHVLRPQTRRKIVLSTNVAETSLTIPGVRAVIDSGLARVMTFDAKVGLPRLQLQPISAASADQRAGRAGRLAAGTCHRLWTKASHAARPQRDVPEVLRSDLSGAVLTLANWGELDVMVFPWLSPPSPDAVDQARLLLRRIGTMDESNRPTELGQRVANIPLHPRVARMILEAQRLDVVREGCLAAALLSQRDPFRAVNDSVRGGRRPSSEGFAGGYASDVNDRVELLQQLAAGDPISGIDPGIARGPLRVAKQLSRQLGLPADQNNTEADHPTDEPAGDRLSRSILAAYPDRVARRRDPGKNRGLMVGQKGVKLHRSSQVRTPEFFVCVDVDSGDTEAVTRVAVGIDLTWLDPRLITTEDQLQFHPTRRAIVARRRTMYLDLELQSTPIACQPSDQTAELLFREAKNHWRHAFPHDDQTLSAFIRRVEFLTRHAAGQSIPAVDGDLLDDVLRQFSRQCTSLAQLQSSAWTEYILAAFDYSQLQRIDAEAPARMRVPSGNQHRINYEDIDAPTLSVKLQELFGWQQTPRLAFGTVPLRLQLLGPNGRPQQVTDDLGSFWRSTYQHIRKDLRGRYPKHHWPENPTTAKATHNGLKPKG